MGTVETACARIFAFLVGAPPNWDEMSPAVRAFGVVISFPTRCEMITTAGKAFFHLHQEVSNYEKYISDALSESCLRPSLAARGEAIVPSAFVHPARPSDSEGKGTCVLNVVPNFPPMSAFPVERTFGSLPHRSLLKRPESPEGLVT